MKQYVLPILAYLLTTVVLDFFGVSYHISYSIRGLLTLALLVYFFRDYKIKFKWDSFAVLIGIVTFFAWIGLENLNINFGIESFDPSIGNLFFLLIAVKLVSMTVIAPAVEELFTRDFLARFFIDPGRWEKVKIGTFGWISFVVTVLVFGFSHSRWLQGIIAGLLYSTVLYRTKRIDTCILAYAVTNLLLALFAIYTQNWALW